MKHRTIIRNSILAAVIVLGLPLTLRATLILEGQQWALCSEGGPETLPKRFTLLQVINDKDLSDRTNFGVAFDAEYLFRLDVESGKVIVRGTMIREDGTEIPLPKLRGRMRLGGTSDERAANTSFARGDMIEWRIRLKNLARLAGADDCFLLSVGVTGSDVRSP